MGIVGTFRSAFGSYYKLRVDVYTASQDIVGNASKVYAVATIEPGSGWINSTASKNWRASIDGQTASGTFTFGQISGKDKQILTTPQKVVKHNADGTKTARVSVTIDVNLTLGNTKVSSVTAESEVTLPSIARASKIASLTNDLAVNGTNECVMELSAAVSTYTHKVTYEIGTHKHTESLTASQRRSAYAIPESWKDAFPSAKSGTMKVTLRTYSGDKQIGSSESGTCLLSCTGSELPEFSMSLSDPTGTKGKIGCYVRGMSKIKAAVRNLELKYGAKVKTIEYTINGVKYSSAQLEVTGASYIESATQTVKATVTDTRGYKRTISETVEAFEYSAPRMSVSVSRYAKNGDSYTKDDEGGYAGIWYKVTISDIDSNRINEVRITYQEQGGTGTGEIVRTDAEYTGYISADTEKVYVIVFEISDKLTSKRITKTLSTAITIWDILKGGKGFAFGGVATVRNLLDVFWNMRVHGSLKVDNPVFSNYTNTIEDTYNLQSGSEWTEVCEIPTLEDGAYSFDIVASFPANATGNRGVSLVYSDDDGETKTAIFTGWTDVRPGMSGWATHCRINANTTVVGRKLYIRAMQTSGSEMNVSIRYSYHRIN